MANILDNLNKQYTDTQALIVLKDNAIQSAHNSILAWKVEAKRLEDRYNAMGWTVSADTKKKALASWNNAESKVSHYALIKTNKTLEKNTLNALLVSIQNNIDDYHEAIESSLSKGIPEEGSIEIADAYVQAELDRVEADLEAQKNIAQAELDNTTGKTLNRKIFIAIGVVVALMVIWFMFKKIKKGKKK